jgi:membrane fusion protein (multidrug efflux system)
MPSTFHSIPCSNAKAPGAAGGKKAGSLSLILLAGLLAGCGGGDQAESQAPPLTVLVTEAERRDVPLYIEHVGSTRGNQDVPIRARVDGFLESMDFQEGGFVSQGDLLYTIDAQPFQARLVEAQSQLAAARTGLAKASSDLERIRPLAEMNAVSQQDLDSAVAQEAAARASVQAGQAAVDLAEIELSYTRITAPIDGLIGLSQAKPGEYVGREPNPVVLNVLSDVEPIRVRFAISERDYLTLARNFMNSKPRDSRRRDRNSPAGDDGKLELILADGTTHPHRGDVIAIAQAVDPQTGTYSIEAAFPNPEKLLLPGQFARVRGVYDTLENAVVVPRQSISELQGLFRVYVVGPDGTVEAREIEKGPDADLEVVVTAGLEAGEAVIVEGLQRVRPGMTVNAQPWTPPAPPGASAAPGSDRPAP